MYPITILAQSSAGSIPSMLLPWLAVVLILVCLWCMIEVIRRIRTGGVTKFNLPLLLICLSTVLVLGFGAETTREIFAAQDFLRAIALLDDPEADDEDLTGAMEGAASDEDKLLAFDVYSRNKPDAGLKYLREKPNLPPVIMQCETKLLINKAVREASDRSGNIRLNDPKILEGLIDRGLRDPRVATFLEQGKFDISRLEQNRLDQLLQQRGATRDGSRIRIRRGPG